MMQIGDRVHIVYKPSLKGEIVDYKKTALGKQLIIALDIGGTVTVYYSMARPEKFKSNPHFWKGPEWTDPAEQAP